MANPQLLDTKWRMSGKTKVHISRNAGISRPRLDYIFAHPETATVGQADSICKDLDVNAKEKQEIFLP